MSISNSIYNQKNILEQKPNLQRLHKHSSPFSSCRTILCKAALGYFGIMLSFAQLMAGKDGDTSEDFDFVHNPRRALSAPAEFSSQEDVLRKPEPMHYQESALLGFDSESEGSSGSAVDAVDSSEIPLEIDFGLTQISPVLLKPFYFTESPEKEDVNEEALAFKEIEDLLWYGTIANAVKIAEQNHSNTIKLDLPHLKYTNNDECLRLLCTDFVVQEYKQIELQCSGVSDLSPISSLPNLKKLQIEDSPVTDLKPLVSCKKLESLIFISPTQTEEGVRFDTAVFYELTQLKELVLYYPLESLDFLQAMNNLEVLHVEYGRKNPIQTLEPLKDAKNLKYIGIDYNGTSLNALVNLPNLEAIELSGMIKLEDVLKGPWPESVKTICVERSSISDTLSKLLQKFAVSKKISFFTDGECIVDGDSLLR